MLKLSGLRHARPETSPFAESRGSGAQAPNTHAPFGFFSILGNRLHCSREHIRALRPELNISPFYDERYSLSLGRCRDCRMTSWLQRWGSCLLENETGHWRVDDLKIFHLANNSCYYYLMFPIPRATYLLALASYLEQLLNLPHI